MDIQNAMGTPIMAGIIVLAALGFLVAIGVVFKGSVHF
jgi:hypothetical protein